MYFSLWITREGAAIKIRGIKNWILRDFSSSSCFFDALLCFAKILGGEWNECGIYERGIGWEGCCGLGELRSATEQSSSPAAPCPKASRAGRNLCWRNPEKGLGNFTCSQSVSRKRVGAQCSKGWNEGVRESSAVYSLLKMIFTADLRWICPLWGGHRFQIFSARAVQSQMLLCAGPFSWSFRKTLFPVLWGLRGP